MGGLFNLTTVAIIFFAGLVALGLTLWMLNRAWGDFPSRVGPGDGRPLALHAQGLALAAEDEDEDDDEYDDDEDDDEDEDDDLPAGAPAESLIEITHPVVRRAVQQALERPGSPSGTFFIRNGERVFLALYRIADPHERELVRDIFEGLNRGDTSDVELVDLLRALNRLGQ